MVNGRSAQGEKSAAVSNAKAALSGSGPPLAGQLAGLSPRGAVRYITARLAGAGCPDAGFDARQLTALAIGADPRLAETPLTAPQAARLAELCERRQSRYPLQYLVGRWSFLDFTLTVGPGVLIPRADTETVCEAAAECIRALPAPQVLDLCAGSGALALGVKRLVPRAAVTALEKSPDALRWLRQNAAQALCPPALPNGTAAEALEQSDDIGPAVTVVEGDVFGYQDTLVPGGLDLIVSNPPYLTGGEMARMQPELRYEPAMALDGGPDGLVFYRQIARAYLKTLRPGGALVLEVGWQQAGAVCGLLGQNGWQKLETRRDYGGNCRAVLARAPDRQ